MLFQSSGSNSYPSSSKVSSYSSNSFWSRTVILDWYNFSNLESYTS